MKKIYIFTAFLSFIVFCSTLKAMSTQYILELPENFVIQEAAQQDSTALAPAGITAPTDPTFVELKTPRPQFPPHDPSEPVCFGYYDYDDAPTDYDNARDSINAKNYLEYLSKHGIDAAHRNTSGLLKKFVEEEAFWTSIPELRRGLRLIENDEQKIKQEKIEKTQTRRRELHDPNPVRGMLADVQAQLAENTNTPSHLSPQEQLFSQPAATINSPSVPLDQKDCKLATVTTYLCRARNRTIITESPFMARLKSEPSSSTDLQNLPTEQPREKDAEQAPKRELKKSSRKVTIHVDPSYPGDKETPHHSKASTPLAISTSSTPTPRQAHSIEEWEEPVLPAEEQNTHILEDIFFF
jgi:hypothetical protein